MSDVNDDQGAGPEQPEPGFDERVAGIVDKQLFKFINEQLPKQFDLVVKTVTKSVMKEIPQADPSALAESAALKAAAILQEQGREFIKDTVAQARQEQPAQTAAPSSEAPTPQPGAPTPAAQPTPGQQIWDQVKNDPGTIIQHLLEAWGKIEQMRKPDPYATLKTIAQTDPELLGLFAPDPLGAQQQTLMADAMRIGLKAKVEAGQIDPLGYTGTPYNGSAVEPQPSNVELEPASAAPVPMTGAGSGDSKRERPRRVRLADLAP